MKNICILNFEGKKFETNIPINCVTRVHVHIKSGDEIITIYKKNGDVIGPIDSAWLANNERISEFNDRSYWIDEQDIKKWNRRKTSYDVYFNYDKDEEDE